MSWNPNSPGTIGLEWLPLTSGLRTLDAVAKSAAALIPSSVTESINLISFYFPPAVAGSGTWTVDVYELDDVVAGAPTETTFRPNEDAAGVNVSTSSGAGSVSSHIDEASLDGSDYGKNTADGDFTLDFRVNVGTGNLTGRRIVSVSLATVAGRTGLSHGMWHALVLGGTQYLGGSIIVADTATMLVSVWDVNPSTGAPWTIAEVEALDTTDEARVFTTGDPAAGTSRLYQAYVVVTSVPENRVATAKLSLGGLSGWQSFDLTTPTGGASWSKTSGVDYLAVLHRTSGTGSASVRTIDAGVASPSRHVSYAPIVASEAGLISDLGNQSSQSVPFVLTTTAPAASADSQAYATWVMEAIYSGRTVQGEITGIVGSYGLVRIVVAQQAAAAGADLTVRLRRRSDNNIMATATITEADLDAPRTTPQVVTVNFASPTTLAAVQYYFEVLSAAADGAGWLVGMLDHEGTSATPGFGGTTNRGTVAGVEADDYDLPATVSTIPTAPANFAVALA